MKRGIYIFFCLILFTKCSKSQEVIQVNGSGEQVAINDGSPGNILVNAQYYDYSRVVFPFTFNIWSTRQVSGTTYYSDFSWDGFKNSFTGTTAYVDPVNGNNSNNGSTPLLAKKSIINAITGTSATTIEITGDFYDYVNGLQGTLLNRDIRIICPSGTATVTTAALASDLVFSVDGTYPNTYSAVYAPSGLSDNALDVTNLNADDIPIKLTPVADAATVNSTPNSIFTNNTTRRVYVRLFDDRAPDANFYYLRNLANINGQSTNRLYVENVNFWGSSGNVANLHNSNSSTTKQSVFVNCQFNYGLDNGTYTSFYAQTFFNACSTYYNLGDGFDYIQSVASGFEFYCRGSYNGYDNNNNNGSTAHDGAKVISVGGTYEYNRGKCIQDIDVTTARYAVGVTSGNSTSTVLADSYGWAVGSGTGLTTMWCIECTASGPQDGWKVFANSQLYWLGGNFASKTNLIQGTATEL